MAKLTKREAYEESTACVSDLEQIAADLRATAKDCRSKFQREELEEFARDVDYLVNNLMNPAEGPRS